MNLQRVSMVAYSDAVKACISQTTEAYDPKKCDAIARDAVTVLVRHRIKICMGKYSICLAEIIMKYIKEIVKKQKQAVHLVCYSVCTANKWVIEAVFEKTKEADSFAVIEATSNQVNQFGAYTGMRPADYKICF